MLDHAVGLTWHSRERVRETEIFLEANANSCSRHHVPPANPAPPFSEPAPASSFHQKDTEKLTVRACAECHHPCGMSSASPGSSVCRDAACRSCSTSSVVHVPSAGGDSSRPGSKGEVLASGEPSGGARSRPEADALGSSGHRKCARQAGRQLCLAPRAATAALACGRRAARAGRGGGRGAPAGRGPGVRPVSGSGGAGVSSAASPSSLLVSVAVCRARHW